MNKCCCEEKSHVIIIFPTVPGVITVVFDYCCIMLKLTSGAVCSIVVSRPLQGLFLVHIDLGINSGTSLILTWIMWLLKMNE